MKNNLKNIKGSLNRDEMKQIIGGCSATATCGATCFGVGGCFASKIAAVCKQKDGTNKTVVCPNYIS